MDMNWNGNCIACNGDGTLYYICAAVSHLLEFIGHALDIHWTPIGYPWDTHGTPMGHPWDTHGTPKIIEQIVRPHGRVYLVQMCSEAASHYLL